MMSLTYELISFIGSPFENNDKKACKELTDDQKYKLYELAIKNKIGLFFLQCLKERNQLHPLEEKYKKDLSRHRATEITAINLSKQISKITNEYAIFKFIKPYPHTPSDVDVLFFSNKNRYLEIVDNLLDNGYAKVGSCPSQIVVYDLRGGYEQMDTRVVNGKKGGKYYIDLYNEVSASHVIYVDKATIKNHKIKIKLNDGSVQSLDPIAELTVVLTHSIIPEQLFTLGDYYTALNYIKEMSMKDLDQLVQIFKKNNIKRACIESFKIIRTIHEEMHGFVPDKILYLLDKIDVNLKSDSKFFSKNIHMPYRYGVSKLVNVLAERMTNKNGLKSILIQGLSMCNPRLVKWVVYNIIIRRKRETY